MQPAPDKIDLDAIEVIHRKDVAATRAGDIEALKSLMDDQCVVFPSNGEAEDGHAYLDRYREATDGLAARQEIVELVQEWKEVRVLGGFAYEVGIVHSAVRDGEGAVTRQSQRLMRILRRQPDGSWRVFRAMWQAPRSTFEE